MLEIGDVGLFYLYFSQSGIEDKMLAELKLKVNGDLTRGREIMSLYKKIVKADETAHSSGPHHKSPYPLYPADSCEGFYEYNDDSTGDWVHDDYFYEQCRLW